MSKFRFIDLFAGIGGFHLALSKLGGDCVFASEINKQCISVYENNFPESSKYIRGDITKITPKDIPHFDVLCAGFPCQSFSKAGLRLGFNDEKRGNLFDNVIRILLGHPECKFIVLENVRNLADNEIFWNYVQKQLDGLDYFVTKKPIVLSPSDFGVPQNRDRVYILGIKKEIAGYAVRLQGEITFDMLGLKISKRVKMGSAYSILDEQPDPKCIVERHIEKYLFAWDEFKTNILKDGIEAPIWLKYFGCGIDGNADYEQSVSFASMPCWKKRIVARNREFYLSHRYAIDDWIKKWGMDDPSLSNVFKKFEWNCKKDCNNLKDGIIQIRHSGIRVKRPTYYPALVAINNTPIVWCESLGHFRFLSVRETARLQSFPEDYLFSQSDEVSYKQLGNSVNVKVVKKVSAGLFRLVAEQGEMEK